MIENFVCSLNFLSFKYLFDMPDEIYNMGNEFLSILIDIWRRKCNDKPKVKFKENTFLFSFNFISD